MMTAIPFWRAAAALLGPMVWAGHFLLVYASESVLCRLVDGRAHSVLLALASLVAVLAVVLLGRFRSGLPTNQPIEHWLGKAGSALDGLAIVAILWTAAAGLALAACG